MKNALKRLDSVHQKLLSAISPLDPSIYSRRPTEGEWSVAEIVHHLCLVEGRVTKELEAAIAREPRRVGFFRRLMPTSIVSLRLIRVKAPKAMNPLDSPAQDQAIENFDRTRTNLKTLCAAHSEERFRNPVFTHPFLGEIDGVATVSFIGYHELRHYKQIREVLRKLGQIRTGER
ncbi:MAG TPA: DinB family protein [Pyrinomonadaceae bacterium]|nr:DinB family protein [Pyrinomonadaceae bacterium]